MANFMRRRSKQRIDLFAAKQDKDSKATLISKAEDLKLPATGLYFLPLGGTGEFGLNLNMYYCDGKWLIVDLGVSFDGTSSINVFMPNINFIKSIPKEDIMGILITHGHEDHLGAVQYLWRYIKRPVYATPFTASLLRRKMQDIRAKMESDLIEINPSDPDKNLRKAELGPFSVEWVSVTHSIPDNSMIIIRTKHGNILHTGDWRFDPDPSVGPASDKATLSKLGEEGVLAVIGDSTNAMTPGKFSSENDVKKNLEEYVKEWTEGRVVIVCFSTNLSRVDSCARIAQKVNRRVALVGRSLNRIRDVALENGYLKGVPEFITEDMAKSTNPSELLIVCTGSQGEPNSGLRRLADNEHPKIQLSKGDRVIISARMITGKEREIMNMINKLRARDIDVKTTGDDGSIHVSGHPPQDDLRELYTMVKPDIGVPVHGEVTNLIAHRDLFRSMGIKSELIHNGDVMHLSKLNYKCFAKVEIGQLGLDGKVLIPRNGTVLIEREWLAAGGCVIINITRQGPEIVLFGVCEHTDHRFRKNLQEKVNAILRTLSGNVDQKTALSSIRNAVQNFIFIERGIDPKIFVFVNELPEQTEEERAF